MFKNFFEFSRFPMGSIFRMFPRRTQDLLINKTQHFKFVSIVKCRTELMSSLGVDNSFNLLRRAGKGEKLESSHHPSKNQPYFIPVLPLLHTRISLCQIYSYGSKNFAEGRGENLASVLQKLYRNESMQCSSTPVNFVFYNSM